MPLVTATKMFEKACSYGYAVGTFSANNTESIRGLTAAASIQHQTD